MDLTLTHVLYGCLISLYAFALSISFTWYGLGFARLLQSLPPKASPQTQLSPSSKPPPKDVRRERHTSITYASILFSVAFFCYACFVLFCYTLHFNYMYGTGLSFANQHVVNSCFRHTPPKLGSHRRFPPGR